MDKRVFVSTDFHGHWPVGSAAVVLAHDADEAWTMLRDELKRSGLSQYQFTVREITEHRAHILCDGNY